MALEFVSLRRDRRGTTFKHKIIQLEGKLVSSSFYHNLEFPILKLNDGRYSSGSKQINRKYKVF
jgi:hypothetical protein